MPFKSEAQRRKFQELLAKGEISQETYNEWEQSTDRSKLPERVASNNKKVRTKFHKARVK